MNELKSLHAQNPNITKLDLSNKKINDSNNIFKELEKFSDLQELDISGNELSFLPDNLSFLANLQVLDITNNLLENFEKVCMSLETLPKLIDLKINLSTQSEALSILNCLSNLEFLNGKSTKDDEGNIIDVDEKEIENISFDKDELEKFNVFNKLIKKLFQKISDKIRTTNKDQEKKIQDQYQVMLKKEIEKINKCIEHAVPNYVYASEIISSKIKISKFFTEKFLEYSEKKDPECTSIFREIFNTISISNSSIFSLLERLYPKITEKTNNLKNQLETALKEASGIDSSIQTLEEKIKQLLKEKEFLIKQHMDERELLTEKMQRLEQENKLITEKFLKRTKDLLNESVTVKKLDDISTYSNNEQALKSKSIIVNNNSNNIKIFPKKLMKDTIEQLYDSKANFDKKCNENKLPRETMEQHMYTFLNHKYGIKNLIIEWASTIINGIKLYSNEDTDVCMFGKILRNECEEDFRHVLAKIKNTIHDLLTFYVKGKLPLKSTGDIKEIVSQKTSSTLQEEEWKEIIFYMYEEPDGGYLYNKTIDLIKRKYIDNKPPSDNKKLTREEIMNASRVKEDYKIPFNDFQKIILDFQLKSHDKFLKNFIFVFKKIDSDNNGIISEEEFINLLKILNVYKEDFNDHAYRLLNIIDPYNKKQITFSDTVTLLNNESIIDDDGQGNTKQVNLLEKISIDDNLLNL